MAIEDIVGFQLKRENAFEGLEIDADLWRDAHRYHRDHQRLHVLAFHHVGMVAGLEVKANDPPDQSVIVGPGMGIDPEGNVIIVPKPQRHALQTREKSTVYLVIQFREILSGPNQPPDGGQPTRTVEAYRIQERDKLPDEPHLELARIDYDPSNQAVTDAKSPSKAGKNEIDLRSRIEAAGPTVPPPPPEPPAPAPVASEKAADKTASAEVVAAPSRETITVGHVVLGGDNKDLHLAGLRNLIGEMNLLHDFEFKLEENVSLDKDVRRCKVLYLTGNAGFELAPKQQEILGAFVESGGVVFGDGCTEGQAEAGAKGAKEFGLAFNQLATQFKYKLESVQRGHTLLSSAYVFSEAPQGIDRGMLLAGGHIVYSASDYGCAWQGGREGEPLPRETIRSSIEMATNVIMYGRAATEGKR